MKVVTLCSGGLDSVTLAYYIHKYQGWEQTLLFVNYGQKHQKESRFALACANDLGLRLTFVRISWMGDHGMYSALTAGSMEIPTGPYTPESLAATVVPNRNAVLANLAASLAVSLDYDGIALAIHAGDHAVYPDTTLSFALALGDLLRESTGNPEFRVHAPFIRSTKADIIETGARTNVPFEKTWSCYVGGSAHCGMCSTCVERRAAFAEADIQDPTVYVGYGEADNAVSND